MQKYQICHLILVCLILTFCRYNSISVQAQKLNYQPRILLVTAHPDDEAVFSATVFKTTYLLEGVVDLAVVTNGEGGYRYSTLANYIYGIQLDEEESGRAHLPEIRKKEVKAAGKILGLNKYFFLDQWDDKASTDIKIPLSNWDTVWVKEQLKQIIKNGAYDFIFTMLPRPTTHSHHQAATLLALRAIQGMVPEQRPIVLGMGGTFSILEGYPITSINGSFEPLTFDRTQRFGYDDRLDYSIITRWVIGEHKSQGAFQSATGKGVERYHYYAINAESGYEKAKEYFQAVTEAKIYKNSNEGFDKPYYIEHF